MGGISSGRRWHYEANDTTSDYRSIDVRRWHREGLLLSGYSFASEWKHEGETVASIQVHTYAGHITLTYQYRRRDGDWESKHYPVRISWTDCHLGGQRPWFHCPASNCDRRVAILYSAKIFACRQCYRLAYPSQREAAYDRAARRADKIRSRLGWEAGILNGEGPKPKGMHWSTFERLAEKHNEYVRQSLAGAVAQFGFDLWDL